MSEELCVEVICFTTVPSSRPSPIIVHRVLFHSAALIMLRLFARACLCSLFFFFLQSFSMPTVLFWTLVTWRKKKETNNGPHMPNKKCVLNNVQSEIIKLPARLWLIFTNIWQDGFVLWVCFGFGFPMPVKALNKCLSFKESSQTLMLTKINWEYKTGWVSFYYLGYYIIYVIYDHLNQRDL